MQLSKLLTQIGVWTSRPSAFAIVLVYVALWILLDRESLNWHGAATIATWFMTLFIQRAEHRDTQALQAKMDELLKATSGARTEIQHIDEEEPETIEKQRK